MISTPEERAELRHLALQVLRAREALEQSHGDSFGSAAAKFDNAAAALHLKLSPARVVSMIDAHEQDLERLTYLTEQAGRVYQHFAGDDAGVSVHADHVIRAGQQRIRDLVVAEVKEALADAAAAR